MTRTLNQLTEKSPHTKIICQLEGKDFSGELFKSPSIRVKDHWKAT